MAEKAVLSDIRAEAVKRWELDEALIVHRVGRIYPGDAIVLVATWRRIGRMHSNLVAIDGDLEIRCSILEKRTFKGRGALSQRILRGDQFIVVLSSKLEG